MKKVSVLSLLTVMALSTGAQAHVESALYMPTEGKFYSKTAFAKQDKDYGLYETFGYGFTNRFALEGTINYLFLDGDDDGFGSLTVGAKYRLSAGSVKQDLFFNFEENIDEDVMGKFDRMEVGTRLGISTTKYTLAAHASFDHVDAKESPDASNNFVLGASAEYKLDDRVSLFGGLDYVIVDEYAINSNDKGENVLPLTLQVNYQKRGVWSIFYTTELKADDIDDKYGIKYGVQF